jgi:ribosomal protein S18 acetylase RimI-like enzyme
MNGTKQMRIEFRQAKIPTEIQTLARFDKKIFGSDAFPRDAWRIYHAWWMLLDGQKIGCSAFLQNVDFQPDINIEKNPRRPGSLYIASTGILPKFQGYGLGKLLKSWQIAHARYRRFERIVTNTRQSNKAMIDLNRQFGFRKIQTVRHYHQNPQESTVVMELVL